MVSLVVVGVQIARLILAIVLAVIAQYIAIKVFDRMTRGIDEFEELRKGNVAIGIIMGAVLLAVATIIASGVAGIVTPSTGFDLVQLGVSFVWLIVAIVVAVIAQFIALSIYGRLTEGIDEERELKKGNLAVAITLGAVIYSIALVVQAGIPKF